MYGENLFVSVIKICWTYFSSKQRAHNLPSILETRAFRPWIHRLKLVNFVDLCGTLLVVTTFPHTFDFQSQFHHVADTLGFRAESYHVVHTLGF